MHLHATAVYIDFCHVLQHATRTAQHSVAIIAVPVLNIVGSFFPFCSQAIYRQCVQCLALVMLPGSPQMSLHVRYCATILDNILLP
jgi:hypothetical protein